MLSAAGKCFAVTQNGMVKHSQASAKKISMRCVIANVFSGMANIAGERN